MCAVCFLSHGGCSVPSSQNKQPKPRASKWEHQSLNPASSDSRASGEGTLPCWVAGISVGSLSMSSEQMGEEEPWGGEGGAETLVRGGGRDLPTASLPG